MCSVSLYKYRWYGFRSHSCCFLAPPVVDAQLLLPKCFCPLTFFQNIMLNMLTSASFISILYSELGCSTGGFPGFVTDCPCGVWYRGLTTCFLYVGPLYIYYIYIYLNVSLFNDTLFFICLISTSQVVLYICEVPLYFLFHLVDSIYSMKRISSCLPYTFIALHLHLHLTPTLITDT